MALLHVMRVLTSTDTVQTGLACVHVNHQLRGTESDDDERFVVEQARRLRLPVVSRRVDVRACAETGKLSLETAGRRLRLGVFAEVAQSYGCAWIATGHQKDDNAETVLQRLRRGTGFRGLAGILPARPLDENLWLARPLLTCTRAEIVAYLRARGLNWRQDRTNSDCRHTRNYVRHRLLPALQSRSAGSLVEGLSGLTVSARKLSEQVGARAREAASRYVAATDECVSVDRSALTALPPIVAVELIRLQWPRLGCGERDVTRQHYENILDLARPSARGRGLTLPGGVSVRTECGKLVLRRAGRRPGPSAGSETVVLEIPGTAALAGYRLEARILGASEAAALKITGDKSPFVEYLDLDRVGRPLVVRGRRPGDRFDPLGLPGEKKLGKFLTAAKVPQSLRKNVLVLDDGQKIVWVCPIRISEHAKVTSLTRRIVRVSVSEERGQGVTT